MGISPQYNPRRKYILEPPKVYEYKTYELKSWRYTVAKICAWALGAAQAALGAVRVHGTCSVKI